MFWLFGVTLGKYATELSEYVGSNWLTNRAPLSLDRCCRLVFVLNSLVVCPCCTLFGNGYTTLPCLALKKMLVFRHLGGSARWK